MEHPASLTDLSPQALRILEPNAPPQLRMMAASGLAPLGPVDLVSVLYSLSYDQDESLVQKARASLGNLPDNVLLGALEQNLDPAVLDGVARLLVRRDDVVERVLLNRVLQDDTTVWLTENLHSERLLEIVAANEERMLRAPRIIEALYMNKASRMSTVDRAIELAIRHGLELNGIPTFAEIKAAIEGQLIIEEPEEALKEDDDFSAALMDEALLGIDDATLDDILDSLQSQEDTPQRTVEEKKAATFEASLAGLSVTQKIRMAMLGNSTQRAVLVRDSNRLVSMAVLKSPGIGDSEVIRYSTARSLPEEAVRYIASKRDWTKQYQVKLNLVNNPRTPLQDALRFLNHLRPVDVTGLERSKDIPQSIVNAARQLRMKRSR